MINYVIKFKNSQNYNLIVKILFILLIFSLFFPIRHVFLTKEAYFTGNYSDFTSFSLYLSDLLVFLLAVIVILPRGRDFYHVVEKAKWLILAILLVLVTHFTINNRLSAYLLVKWLELIVAYGTLALLFEQNGLKSLFLKLFAWFCTLESTIAFIQFSKQSSLGLSKLGESVIGPNILGIAKIVSGGTTFIRGYGTFPHPNPLSAFLVAGILITTYLLINSSSKKAATLYSTLLFINIIGLTLTFSRGAYLALAAGLTIFFSSLFFIPLLSKEALGEVSKKIIFTLVVIFVSLAVSFFLFKPFLLTRATFSDQSTMDRKFYDVTGVKMAIANPIFGVGLGESLLHMEQYSGRKLAPWDKQPPHNYFIIAAAELGIPAMLILVWIFLSALKSLILNLKSKLTTYNLLLATIFISFLLLMLFDHYFYTLDQTQLLLWLFLALIASETKKPSTGEPLKS
jgi:O-antigen ligase